MLASAEYESRRPIEIQKSFWLKQKSKWEYRPLPKHQADLRGLSQPSIQKFGQLAYRTTRQRQGSETASTVRQAPKPTERPLAAPAMALIDAVAPSGLGTSSGTAEAAQHWCRVWCKTKCNKLPECMQRSHSQPYSPLHGMQGVSGSSPLGSITSDSLRRKGSFCCTGSCWQARRGRKAQNRSPRMGPDLNGWTAQARERAMALEWSSS